MADRLRVIRRRFPDFVDARLERIYEQWVNRERVRDPGVVRTPGRRFLRRLVDAAGVLRRFGRPRLEVDVLVELSGAVRTPGFLRGVKATEDRRVFLGSLDIEHVPRLAVFAGVRRVEAARGLRVRLAHSVPKIGAEAGAQATAFAPHPAYTGKGVVVGILDTGCDVKHPSFRDANGGSRIQFLWRQNDAVTSRSPQPWNYGQEFTKADIDLALTKADPYQELDGSPSPNCHGCHVMDIAAGSGAQPGVAPDADIICVRVLPDDVDDTDFMGNSMRLVQAAEYVFARADQLGKPAVINLSLGANGGPHDGTSLVDDHFAELLETPGRAIVVAAGNGYEACRHASGRVPAGKDCSLTWLSKSGDHTDNELEVWYSGGPLQVFVTPPRGQEAGPFNVNANATFSAGGANCHVVHSAVTPGNGLNHVDIFMTAPVKPGAWKVRMRAAAATAVFDAWIEREMSGDPAARPTQFRKADADDRRTLDALACGEKPIVVGAYRCDDPGVGLSSFTACGTTRDGRQKPDLCAPGERTDAIGIFAAGALSTGLTTYSGTSQAAPHVTGLVALMMQKALEEQPPRRLTIDEIRTALTQSARPVDPLTAWDERAGFGRVDAIEAIRKA